MNNVKNLTVLFSCSSL